MENLEESNSEIARDSVDNIAMILRSKGVDIDTTAIDPISGRQDDVLTIAQRLVDLRPPVFGRETLAELAACGIFGSQG